MLVLFLRKRALPALFLLFFLSCSKPYQHWHCQKIATHAYYDSAKVYWETDNKFSGININMICTNDEALVYLDIAMFVFPSNEIDDSLTEVTIAFEGKEESCLAERFEGGQRLLLPQEAAHLIIELLSREISFTLYVGRYCEKVSPIYFLESFQKTQSIWWKIN